MTEPGDYAKANLALSMLRDVLGTMTMHSPTGDFTALDVSQQMLDTIATVVLSHQRSAQMEAHMRRTILALDGDVDDLRAQLQEMATDRSSSGEQPPVHATPGDRARAGGT